jgi:septum formation protein
VPQRRLILASASPRRQEALKALGLAHEIVVSHAEETLPPQPDPTDPLPAARAKAADVLTQHPDATVLAGDTIVAVGKVALGKPGVPERAVEMLRTLRGTRHAVHTSVVLRSADGSVESTVVAPLAMRDYSDDEIGRYVATGEPLDCAGAYDIHREGGTLIASYEGCFSAIVGLPIVEAARHLTAAGAELRQRPEEVCSALYGRRCLASDASTRPRCLSH